MTSAPHWSGLLASAILVAVATVWLVWTIVATPGYSSSHLNIVNRAEDASSGTPRAQAWRPGSGTEQVWVRAEHAHTPAQDGSGREGGRVYRWEALGREWAVRVWEDAGFLAPSMLMRHESEREATVMPPTLHARCFYTGVLLGANDSAVALSICRGLVSNRTCLALYFESL
nr:A disintegrin and metalloproteinase with thrombospondin motifs 15-like [Procambarus clarkii]